MQPSDAPGDLLELWTCGLPNARAIQHILSDG
jgi:hypothetical protein